MTSPPERRRGPDRRRAATPMLSRHWFRGRRRGGRRDDEAWNIYVDRPSPRETALVLALVALALIDCAWTLAHLHRGVLEANPLMAWVWEAGGTPGFAAAKVGVTSLAALVLLLHTRFRMTRRLLPVAVICYTLLLGVHAATEMSVGVTMSAAG